jgi:hypothetical protein
MAGMLALSSYALARTTTVIPTCPNVAGVTFNPLVEPSASPKANLRIVAEPLSPQRSLAAEVTTTRPDPVSIFARSSLEREKDCGIQAGISLKESGASASHPASLNNSRNCTPVASPSGTKDAYLITMTADGLGFPLSALSSFSPSITRGPTFSRNSASLISACTARSLALPAAFMASPSLSLDRFLSSVWIRPPHIPNKTSPTMPNAITASAVAVPHCSSNESYAGWTPVRINSATTATTTNPAHPIPHRSQDDDASSSWSSLAAFIVPRGKYHSGKGNFRAFLIGMVIGALIFAILFAVSYL